MTPDRWEQINRLYYAALDVAEKDRASFLEQASDGDFELCREVESLLATHKAAGGFLGKPAMEEVARELKDEPASLLGRQLGTYQILGVLGAGGMGEVYKARDTRLNRTVAIKVLPRLLSERADLRQRFDREARAIASLNHPNICALYDIGRQDQIDFLVMEYLEGETLSKRLKKGHLPTEQLLRTAIEVATALDQAHRHGVTHRDLKPGNIMLTKAGAKLLDFGLAKQRGRRPPVGEESPIGDGLPLSRTKSENLTEEGMLLGTLEYMAPEQLEGKEADARTDMFAFGVVMYEMATGRKAFEGESKASLTAAILTYEPPPITKSQPLTPPALERLVKRCLAKDPDERWQSARDLSSELKWIAEAGGGAPATAAGARPIALGRRRELLFGALAITFLVAAIVSAVSYLRLARAPAHAIISEILPPEKTQLTGPPVLSPDGGAVAFSATDASGKNMLWIRSFNSLAAQPLAGTEGGASPFWSANGRALGFFSDGKLKATDLSGGPAIVVADATVNRGGTWNRQGTLLFVPDTTKGLYQVAASGGTPVPVLELDKSKNAFYMWPKFLPDGKHFLYWASAFDPASRGTYFASVDGKENRLLLKARNRSSGATYASGFLLYLRDKVLMAQAFDPGRGQLKADAHPIAQRVASDAYGNGFFDVSENGVLIYQGDPLEDRRITWFDRGGKELSVGEGGMRYQNMRLSPDGVKLGFNAGDSHGDIWVEELARGVRMRLTNNPGTDYGPPVWSPDGSRILFAALQGKARLGIYQKNSNGTGGQELLLPADTSDPQIWPTSWSSDGRFILFVRGNVWNPIQDLWVLPLAGDRKPRFLVQNAFDGQFSPDGRWVAYTSVESGKAQVCVVPFDATTVLNTSPGSLIDVGDKWQISSEGAIARWRGDGKEIFYYGPGRQLMAAEVEGRNNSFAAGKGQALFRPAAITAGIGQYDVTPDGKRFVMATQKVSNPNPPLTLVVNWTARLDSQQ